MSVSTSTPSEDNETSITIATTNSASLSVNRDQLAEGMSLTVTSNLLEPTPEYSDPAILEAKPASFRYAREKLLELRQVPLAQKRPDYLDIAYNNSNGIWDPELWHRSRFDTGHENGEVVYKRRPGDPRERLRKEDGIVLSPQRRSFNSGCFVPLKEHQRLNRPHSPINGKSDSNMGQFRDIPSGSRRIGSGRILSRDVPWDFQDKESDEFSYRKDRREDREERFERRSYGRDYDMNKEKDKHLGRNNRFNERRRIDSHNEEPEWFSGGPVSQHETIELRGFDDHEEKTIKAKRQPPTKKKKERKNSEQNENKQPQEINILDKGAVDQENNNTNSEVLKNANDTKHSTADENMFNLDDILKCDMLAGLLNNGADTGHGDAGSSRFSQFFTRTSPVKQNDSRRSSFQDDHIIRNVLNDITEPNVTIPSDSDLYFAPISPAANTTANIGSNAHHSVQKPVNIFEMLQRGKQPNTEVPAAKVVSLEELEARILQHGRSEQLPNVKLPIKSENDSVAFERLVAQMKGGHGPNNGTSFTKIPPISMFEQALQDETSRNSQMLGPPSPNILHNELAFKLQQVQNQVQAQRQQSQIEMMNKLMNAGLHRQQLGTSPLPEIGVNQSRELLNRPEAQAILQALHQRIPSPRELQQHTQAIMQNALIKKKLEEQQENYKRRQEHHSGRGVSPAKHTSSPTPLAFTPTSVLRKMTADKDDGCTKPQPQGRPVTGMKPNVLQSQTWNLQQQLKQPVGRPIVKANANLQAQSNSQGQHDLHQFYQQQRLYGQPQQQSRKVGQQQYPSQSGASSTHQSLLNHMHHQYQFSSNPQQFQQQHLTQHQLRAQHQQHQPPQQMQQSQFGSKPNLQQHWSQQHQQMLAGHNYDSRSSHLMGDRGSASNNGGELSPIANQLARWFPPELLEKARAGKVPSMPNSALAQHAINLEEMERHTAPPIHN